MRIDWRGGWEWEKDGEVGWCMERGRGLGESRGEESRSGVIRRRSN